MEYSTRGYKEGDIPKQLEIMKKVTRELYPIDPYNLDNHTVKLYERLYSRIGWQPVPFKFLLDNNKEIIGYSGYGSLFNHFRLFYPYILEEHRTDELMQRLFDEGLEDIKETSKKYDSYRIFSRSDLNLTHHNAFWEKQKYVKKRKGYYMHIETEKLNQPLSSQYGIKYFTREDIERVSLFSKECSHLDNPFISEKDLMTRIELGNIAPKTHVILERENEIQAFIGLRVAKSLRSDANVAAVNLEYLDETSADDDLRKALMIALYPIFKEFQIERIGFEILEDSK